MKKVGWVYLYEEKIFECQNCGCLSLNKKLHEEWHKEFNKLALDVREMRNKIWIRK